MSRAHNDAPRAFAAVSAWLGPAALSLAVHFPHEALGQTSCRPAMEVPGTNGSVVLTSLGDIIAFPGTTVRLTPYECAHAVAYTSLWSPGGQTTATISPRAPGAGVSTSYELRTSSAGETKVGTISIRGADVGRPLCSVSTPSLAANVGQEVTVTATCTPSATRFHWSSPGLVSDPDVAQARYRLGVAGTHPVSISPSNGFGLGPAIGLVFNVGGGGTPVTPRPPSPVSAGAFHVCALTAAGGVSCWGRNDQGQLGNGTTSGRNTPSAVTGLSSSVAMISAGNFHNCAVSTGGLATCWGNNATGQLGDGTNTGRSSPTSVVGLGSGVRSIAAGGNHTCALTTAGAVKCWGDNGSGQLGNGTTARSNTPVSVSGLDSGVVAISAGSFSTCALTSIGAVKCWGDNQFGQLGDGTLTSRSSPVEVSGLGNGNVAIAVNRGHACALTSAGGVKCWGENATGQMGNGTRSASQPTPVNVSGLGQGVSRISAGFLHNCALMTTGSMRCWGDNEKGQLGDGTTVDRLTPVSVTGISADLVAIGAHFLHTCAETSDGGLNCWGDNAYGQLGDGTLAPSRELPQRVVGAAGTGFFDMTPADGLRTPVNAPAFPMVVSGQVTETSATAVATIPPPPAGNQVYVFAWAPASVVKSAEKGKVAPVPIMARSDRKATPVQCVLAQLNSSGQLQGVPASSLQAYIGSVSNAQGQSVTILNGVSVAQIGGATFFVGHGPTSAEMFENGTSRSAVGIPGSVRCQPQAPQKGWWWNPSEAGRGYSLEVQGNKFFFAAFLYDVSGRASWHVATGRGVSLDGSLIQGDLLGARGGQSLGGPYPGMPAITTVGPMTLAFNDANQGTLVWPGGTVTIERFNIVPNGLTLPAEANQPEEGWWWNPQESGRGFFMEWQGGVLNIAGYTYDEAGNPIWYLTQNPSPSTNLQQFSSSWWQFADGMTLMGPWRPHRPVSSNVAPVTIQFQGAERAVMTLPNGRTTTLQRHRF